MRTHQPIVIALVIVVGLSGCASKQRQEIVLEPTASATNVAETHSDYWTGSDGCDACDSSAGGQATPNVAPEPSNRWNPFARPFAKRADEQIVEASLTCAGCNMKYDVLVDGICVDCMKRLSNGTIVNKPNALERFPNKVDQFVTRIKNAGSRRSFKPAMDSNADSIVQSAPEFPILLDQLDLPDKLPEIRLPEISVAPAADSQAISAVKAKKPAKDYLSRLDESKNQLDESTKKKFESSLDELKSVREDVIADVTDKLPLKVDTGAMRQNTGSEPVLDQKLDIAPERMELSAEASVAPDPKFETFKLDDLFIEKPGKKNLPGELPEKQPQDDAEQSKNQTQPAAASSNKPRRSEQAIVRDLQNSVVPNQVVFDNTPLIREQVMADQQIVLTAAPVKSYHEIQRLAESKKMTEEAASSLPTEPEAEYVDERRPNSLRAIQVKSQRRIEQRDDVPMQTYDFSPLPVLQAIVEEVDVSSASSIEDEIYEPYGFPEHESHSTSKLEDREPTFEFNGHFDSLSPGEAISAPLHPLGSAASDTNLTPEESDNLPVKPFSPTAGSGDEPAQVNRGEDLSISSLPVFEQPISNSGLPPLTADIQASELIRKSPNAGGDDVVLRAIPKNNAGDTFNSSRNQPASKASFRFIQPKYQRVIDYD